MPTAEVLQWITPILATASGIAAVISAWQNTRIQLAIACLKADLLDKQSQELSPIRERISRLEVDIALVKQVVTHAK